MTPEEEYFDLIKAKKLKDMTNTQVNFLKYMLENKEQFNKIGNLEIIFATVRNYWKGR